MPVALRELKEVYGCKRAFIVTDSFLYTSGFTKKIEGPLDEMGITHSSFWSISPDPKLQDAEKGEELLRAFNPDVIIAIGGGSAMDAGKIMWTMYEHPEEKFDDMAVDFMDIRKRVYRFKPMGQKAKFVAIPTSSGTGSEVTPFAIITDANTGIKWPITDYELMPTMSIVDTDNMMTQPKGLTSASGIDVLTHAMEAYVSIMASDYTDAIALKAAKLVFDWLPTAYSEPTNVEARDHMANASCLAGMAFANAFLGLNHSMAHKLGAYHHIPHGWANAVILTRVARYNAAERPTRMGTFSQYEYPHAKARYAEMGRFCGFGTAADSDDVVFERFMDGIEKLKDFIGVKKTIAEYGVDEKYFLDTLDEMSLNAFNDQCTGANPRYPLVAEIRSLYLDAYYGRPATSYEDEGLEIREIEKTDHAGQAESAEE
jgi:acetaldehyde dehydrogenase/alcohol dehydrogenase